MLNEYSSKGTARIYIQYMLEKFSVKRFFFFTENLQHGATINYIFMNVNL